MQRELRVGPSVQPGRTKYVFAATQEHDEPLGTKVCPRCGETLFEDMDVCYGCLYDFTRDEKPKVQMRTTEQVWMGTDRPVAIPSGDDPLASIELDEIDDEPEIDSEPKIVPEPRHSRRERPSAEDTLDLSAKALARPSADETFVASADKEMSFRIVIDSDELNVRVPLTSRGLSVGRGEGNDIILKSRSVSRSHVRLLPHDGKVLVEDRGATNPALVRGLPLEGTVFLQAGEELSVCGVTFEVEGSAVGPTT